MVLSTVVRIFFMAFFSIKPLGTENADYVTPFQERFAIRFESVNLDLMGKSAIDFLNKNGIPDDECKKLTKAKVDGALLLLLDPDGLIKLGISVIWAYKIHDLVQKCKSAHAYSVTRFIRREKTLPRWLETYPKVNSLSLENYLLIFIMN